MSQIDASGLTFSYSAQLPSSVDLVTADYFTPSRYTWHTAASVPFYRVSALSYANDMTIAPYSGTVQAVTITNDALAAGIGITQINVALTSLVTASSAGTQSETFWRTVLAGPTTLYMPTNASVGLSIGGDFHTVLGGQVLLGAADNFVGSVRSSTVSAFVTGDAFEVAAGATLTGGKDVFRDYVAANVFGDASLSQGTTWGGADSFIVNDTSAAPLITVTALIGDVELSRAGAVHGGADSFTLRNFDFVSALFGDVRDTISGASTFGGNDAILLETTVPGRTFGEITNLAGDESAVRGTSVGGNDAIKLTNISASQISGDFLRIEGGRATGGADSILYRGVALGGVMSFPYATSVAGDAIEAATVNEQFTGGHDTVVIENAYVADLSGDVGNFPSARYFTGGNDRITVTVHSMDAPRTNIFGDAATSSSGNFVGGNDIITLQIDRAEAINQIVGDVGTMTVNGSTRIQNGNDVIAANSGSSFGSSIFGDGDTINSPTSLVLIDGNDTIAGGVADDLLVGDTLSFPSYAEYTPGNDVLDGGAGNDRLYGGGGVDTAVFSLAQSVHVDLGNELGLGEVSAIGQGFDTLVQIENVTGSPLDDTLIGWGGVNVLKGMGGNDRLDGRTGADRLEGGIGNDSYTVDVAGDVVIELAGQGSDLVQATASYALGAGQSVEILQLAASTGSLALNLSGNEGANTLVGNAGANALQGGGGGDTLIGAGGRDTLVPGNDTVGDLIRFNAISDSTGGNRDMVLSLDANGEDKLAFAVKPTAYVGLVTVGALNSGANFDANIASAVNGLLGAGGAVEAVLFDPNSGNLNQAGYRYLVVDANNDGSYTANADYLVELVNTLGTLDATDFV